MIKNFTPHELIIHGFDGDGVPPLRLQSDGVARCAPLRACVGEADGASGIPLYRVQYGEVIGLPDPEPGVILVVSLLVRQALPNRTDLASPGELIRDAAGQPVGCRGLDVN